MDADEICMYACRNGEGGNVWRCFGVAPVSGLGGGGGGSFLFFWAACGVLADFLSADPVAPPKYYFLF